MFQFHAESQGNDIYFSIQNNNTNQTNNIYFLDYSHIIKDTHRFIPTWNIPLC